MLRSISDARRMFWVGIVLTAIATFGGWSAVFIVAIWPAVAGAQWALMRFGVIRERQSERPSRSSTT